MAPAIPFLIHAAVQLAITAVEVGVTMGINALLAPKPPSNPPGFQTVKQAIPDRVRGWGRCRLYGAIMLDEAVGANLYRVWAFHDGQVDGIERIYFNDDLIYLADGFGASSGWVAGGVNNRYHPNHVWMEWRLGLTPETAYADLVAEQPALWSNSCRGDGIASLYQKCIAGKSNDNPGLFPYSKPDVSMVYRQGLAYDWRLDSTQPGGNGPQRQNDPATWTFSRNPIVCLVNELWRYRGYGWASRFAPTLALLTAEANICDQPVPVLNCGAEVIVKASVGDQQIILSDASGLHAGMTIHIRPNEQYQDQVVVASVTPYARSYVTGYIVGLTTPLQNNHALRDPVVWTSDPAAPATEPRWTADTFFAESATLADVITPFRVACDGWIARNGFGAMIIRAGHYYAPTVTLEAEDVVDYEWSSYVEDSQAVNELRPQFTYPAADFRTVETDAWRDEGDIAARGQTRSTTLDLPAVQSTSQARRLAKRKMSQLLAGNGTIRCKLSALTKGALGERYLGVNLGVDEIEELQNAVVEVIDDPVISDDGATVVFTVCAADPNVDAWDYTVEEGTGPILANLGDIPELSAPVITSASAFFESNGTSGEGVRIEINGTGPDRADLIWYVNVRVSGAAVFVTQSFPDATAGAGGAIMLETGFVTANTSIEVQIAYATGANYLSDWSASAFVDTSTANIAPEVPTNIAAAGGVGKATITWRNPNSANFAASRVWKAAHGAAFATAIDISGPIAGGLGADQSYDANGLAAGDYDFWVTAENAGGVAAPPDGPVEATVT